jgi:hypothetical protein
VRFRFIAAEKAEHSITILCRCLRVTRRGFYAWQRRPESAHAQADRRLRVSGPGKWVGRLFPHVGIPRKEPPDPIFRSLDHGLLQFVATFTTGC